MPVTVTHKWSVSARQQNWLLLLLLQGMMHCPIPGSVFVTPRRSCNDQQASDRPSMITRVSIGRLSPSMRGTSRRQRLRGCTSSALLRGKQSITFGGPSKYLNPRQNDAYFYFVSSGIRRLSRRREVLMIRWLGRVVSSPRSGMVRAFGERSVYSHVSV